MHICAAPDAVGDEVIVEVAGDVAVEREIAQEGLCAHIAVEAGDDIVIAEWIEKCAGTHVVAGLHTELADADEVALVHQSGVIAVAEAVVFQEKTFLKALCLKGDGGQNERCRSEYIFLFHYSGIVMPPWIVAVAFLILMP